MRIVVMMMGMVMLLLIKVYVANVRWLIFCVRWIAESMVMMTAAIGSAAMMALLISLLLRLRCQNEAILVHFQTEIGELIIFYWISVLKARQE